MVSIGSHHSSAQKLPGFKRKVTWTATGNVIKLWLIIPLGAHNIASHAPEARHGATRFGLALALSYCSLILPFGTRYDYPEPNVVGNM